MAEVVLENIRKSYSGERGHVVAAVDGISLTIEDREFMVFVGPSGCGKSTTLRLIAGLEEITSGSIYIDGKKVNEVAPKDRDIAMVFQNYALYPHMSVYKNMAFGLQLRNYARPEIEKRVREAAQILGLTDEMLTRKPKALSGGQRQRVALGRAIVRKPKVFLFDEPLSNLDAKMRVQMRTEISKLHQQLATTMIYVTHDQVEAMTMGDRICIMKDGRIQQVARPLEIYHEPANMFVAAFIGNPPMNFFEGTIIDHNDKLYFSTKNTGINNACIELAIEENQSSKLKPWWHKPIYLGLRPEDIKEHPPTNDSPAGCTLRASIDLVEAMGSETLYYLKAGADNFIMRSHGSAQNKASNTLDLIADMTRAHFFEAADRGPYQKNAGSFDLEKWQAACRCIV